MADQEERTERLQDAAADLDMAMESLDVALEQLADASKNLRRAGCGDIEARMRLYLTNHISVLIDGGLSDMNITFSTIQEEIEEVLQG